MLNKFLIIFFCVFFSSGLCCQSNIGERNNKLTLGAVIDSANIKIKNDCTIQLLIDSTFSCYIKIGEKKIIKTDAFFWEERKNEKGIFDIDTSFQVVKINDHVYFLSVPVAEEAFVGYLVQQQDGAEFEINVSQKMYSETGFVFLPKSAQIAIPIVRGTKSGVVQYFNIDTISMQLVLDQERNFSFINGLSASSLESILRISKM